MTREAILEETMSACAILGESSCSRIALEGDLGNVTRQEMLDATTLVTQKLQIQVQNFWQPIR